MIKEAIASVVNGKDLDDAVMSAVMDEIMSGSATDAQKAAFLTALSIKGETIAEITAAAKVMRAHATEFSSRKPVLEIVGTGGDHSNTFNISTISSLVVSSLGIPVAKHGNRAASSKCGAADVLEALGADITISPERSQEILEEINFCFLFAQKYHASMRFVGGVRKEIAIRTLFNILGPLANPAGATSQLLGVYSEAMVEPLAHVLVNLGVHNTVAVFGQDCMDEISLSAPTTVCESFNGEFTRFEITPEQFGFERCQKADLVGGTPEENAQIARDILGGASGPQADAVLLNAGMGVHTARPEHSIAEGIEMVREAISSGRAQEQLERFIEATHRG